MLQALAKTEDETDAISAEQVKAEQKAELAEFDENIPWDEQEAVNKEEDDSRVEKELAMLEKEVCNLVVRELFIRKWVGGRMIVSVLSIKAYAVAPHKHYCP